MDDQLQSKIRYVLYMAIWCMPSNILTFTNCTTYVELDSFGNGIYIVLATAPKCLRVDPTSFNIYFKTILNNDAMHCVVIIVPLFSQFTPPPMLSIFNKHTLITDTFISCIVLVYIVSRCTCASVHATLEYYMCTTSILRVAFHQSSLITSSHNIDIQSHVTLSIHEEPNSNIIQDWN